MIYFTADLHLGHKNIIKFCKRPFSCAEEMDEVLIHNWNSLVTEKDSVFILGDFAHHHFSEYLNRFNGHKILIPGSHDKLKSSDHLIDNLKITEPIYEIYPDDLFDEYKRRRLIVLCHYSMRSWNKSHYASYHLFGHHHNRLEPYGLSFDIGVDTNNYFPYSLNDIETKMKTLKPVVDFRSK